MFTRLTKLLKEIHPEIEFTSDLNLIEQGILDSFDLIILTAELEKEFKIKIKGEDINSKNFASVNTIVNLINGSAVSQ